MKEIRGYDLKEKAEPREFSVAHELQMLEAAVDAVDIEYNNLVAHLSPITTPSVSGMDKTKDSDIVGRCEISMRLNDQTVKLRVLSYYLQNLNHSINLS